MKMYMKKLVVPLLICLSLFGCGNDGQKPNTDIENSQNVQESSPMILDNLADLSNADLQEIAVSYEICFGIKHPLQAGEIIDFSSAFKYMYSGGAYLINPSNLDIIPEIDSYYDKETGSITLPKAVAEKLVADGKVKQLEIESYEIIDGNYIIQKDNWSLRPELRPYWNDYLCKFENVPAKIVDEYILSKFDTKIDHSAIYEYDEISDTYTFQPHMGGCQYSIKLKSKEIDGDTIKLQIMAVDSHDVDVVKFPVEIVLQLVDGEYKFVSVTPK